MGLKRLEIIAKLNERNKSFVNKDLYRLLYSKELYIIAYENIKGNKGALTPATSGETLQGFSIQRIDKLIEQMRLQSWKPKLARQILIPKPGKTTLRPLGIQGPEDKIVQEIVRMILNAIYNASFDKNSYGFRPNLGCHNALQFISENFDGITKVIEGDIQSFFPTVCHNKLISIMKRRIDDQRFMDVIFKMLRAGFWNQNDGTVEKPDIGTPQGSIVSPILSNIYLNELDNWIRKWEENNISNTGKLVKSQDTKRINSVIKHLEKQQKLDRESNLCSTQNISEQIRKVKLERMNYDYYDNDYRKDRLLYVRYADDFVIGLFGPDDLAPRLKQELTQFLKEELSLTLSQEKTNITDIRKEAAIFLGHEIYISITEKIKLLRKNGMTPFHKRTTGKFVKIEMPIQRVIDKLHLKGFCTKLGYPISCKRLTVYDDPDIILYYNTVLNGYLNYYSGTKKTNPKYRIIYIIRFSCAKTLAHRHKSTLHKIFEKYGSNLKITKEIPNPKRPDRPRVKETSIEPSATLKKPKFQLGKEFVDPYRVYLGKFTRSNLFSCCLICGSPDRIEMHHLNSLKNIRPRTFNQLHGYVKRKQIPLCFKHHRDVTYGRYDDIPLKDLLLRTQLTYDPAKADYIESTYESNKS